MLFADDIEVFGLAIPQMVIGFTVLAIVTIIGIWYTVGRKKEEKPTEGSQAPQV